MVPKTVDDYLDLIEKAKTQNELQLLMNPVWHVHNSKVPKENMIMSISMHLNQVETSNADSKKIIKKKKKKYRIPSEEEKNALKALIKTLDKCNNEMKPEDIQTLIYSTGKENGYAENLRDWFKLIYEVVFGDVNGPRMGFFISFFGVNETKQLLKDKIK